VRWPARPVEHRAGLDFFGTFFIKKKSTANIFKRGISFMFFLLPVQRKKEKHTGNDVRPLPDALIKLQYYC
jgi:hypothetical protein